MMASKETIGKPVCPMCFESPPAVKIVGTCKHAFCRECLSTHLESLSSESKSFPCPTCRVECPLPDSGVDGLVDYDGAGKIGDVDVGNVASETEASKCRKKVKKESDTDATNKKSVCQSCLYKNNEVVEADNLCEDCDHLYLCGDCTRAHGNNKATQDHVVIPLKAEKKKTDGCCGTHKTRIKSYCCTCSQPVCKLCVLFDHGDHTIKKFGEVFRSVFDQVKATKQKQEKKSKELKNLEKELEVMKSSVIGKQDTLVKAIEDHAEKCVDQILKQKEVLKKKVRNHFSVIKDITTGLEKIKELVASVDKSVTNANRLLSETEPHPEDLENLSSIKDEMETSGGLADAIDSSRYWEPYYTLFQNAPYFVPKGQEFNIGTIEKEGKLDRCQIMFQQQFNVHDNAKFIPCVANLGEDFFGVAHPTNSGKPSDAIDIYEFPGTLKQTLREHVYPVYDMAATPDGKLAVLSDGSSAGTCCVRIFDPETGYIRSTKDLTVRGLLSFHINIRHQYVILSSDGGRSITVFNEDGSVECTHLVENVQSIKDASRIACGGRNIFIMGGNNIALYEQKEDEIVLITTSKGKLNDRVIVKDISGTLWDELYFSFLYSSGGMFVSCTKQKQLDTGNTIDWIFSGCSLALPISSQKGDNINNESRVSVRGSHIVVSRGQLILVFKR